MMGTKDLLSNFAISGCVKDSVAVRRQSAGHPIGQQRNSLFLGASTKRTMTGFEADAEKYQLVFLLGSLHSLIVEQLPCDRGRGLAAHVRACALARSILEGRHFGYGGFGELSREFSIPAWES